MNKDLEKLTKEELIAEVISLRKENANLKSANKNFSFEKYPYLALIQQPLLNILPQRIFIKDLNSKYIAANKTFADDLNTTTDSIIGKSDYELYPEAEAERYKKNDDYVINTGKTHESERKFIIKDRTYWINLLKTPLLDYNNKIVGILGVMTDLTTRRNIEEELRIYHAKLEELVKQRTKELVENQRLLSTVTAEAPVVIFAIDKDGIFTFSDGKGLKAIGLKPGQVVGQSVFDVYKSNEGVINSIRRVLQGEEVRIINQVGNNYYNSTYRPIRDKEGNIEGLVGVSLEVTDKYKLKEERQHFFNTTLALLCRATLDGYFTDLNPAWVNTLGYSFEELKGRQFLDFLHIDDIEPTVKEIQNLRAGEKTINFANRYKTKNGRYRWLSWYAAAYGDTIYASAIDITETKKIEKKLRESEARFKAIFESVQDCIMVWDKNHHCLYANQAALDMFVSQSKENDQDTALKELQEDSGFMNRWGNRIDTVFANNLSFTVKDSYSIRGKLIHSQSIISPIYDTNGKIFAAGIVFRDITQLEENKLELERHAKELERSNADLEQFAYVSSHDLQEPLRKIKNYTELLDRKLNYNPSHEIKDYMSIISRGASRMQNLINDLLSYSRLTTRANKFSDVDLNLIMERVLDTLELPIHKSGANIDIGILPHIQGDESQLDQLFQNLLSNALKFRREVPLIISIKSEITTSSDIIIRFTDNGIGLDMQYSEKIFIIFQRLHSRDEYEGTGIGLAICKKIMDRHGGDIWVESLPDNGTTFFLKFPGIKKEA